MYSVFLSFVENVKRGNFLLLVPHTDHSVVQAAPSRASGKLAAALSRSILAHIQTLKKVK